MACFAHGTLLCYVAEAAPLPPQIRGFALQKYFKQNINVNFGQIYECRIYNFFLIEREKIFYLHINMATMPNTKPMRPAFVGVH